MANIHKSYWEKEPDVTFSHLSISNIDVLKIETHYDCTNTERIKFTFHTSNPGVFHLDPDEIGVFILIIDINTNYVSDKEIRDELHNVLKKYPILHEESILDAFKYRFYYCKL